MRAREVDDEPAAFLLEAGLRPRVAAGLHDDRGPPPSGAAAEVDLLDRCRRPAGAALTSRGRRRRPCRRGAPRRRSRRRDVRPCCPRRASVGLHAVEVEDEPRATAGLGSDDRVDAADLDVDAPRIDRERRVRQVDGEARGVVDRERQRLRRRAVQHEPHLDLLAGLRLQLDLLQAARRLRPVRPGAASASIPASAGSAACAARASRVGPARAAVVRVQRCSGHTRISLQIICSARLRRGAR